MSFLKRIFARPDPEREAAVRIADAVMSGARQPGLFLKGLAADDFDGRFQMVALHGALVMRRLKAFGTGGLLVSEKLGEVLFDRFDYAYREEGVGDASIARKVRKLGERYFGLARALDAALNGEESIESVLVRNGVGKGAGAELAAYVAEADTRLSELPEDAIRAGRIEWPAP